jgi:hypothetical protein
MLANSWSTSKKGKEVEEKSERGKRTRRGQDNPFDGLGLVDRVEHVLRALQGRLDALLQPVLDLLRDEEGRSNVVYDVAAGHGVLEGARLEEVSLEQAQLSGVGGLEVEQRLALSRVLEVADGGVDGVSALQEGADGPEADVAGAACDERSGHFDGEFMKG